jgi:acyl-coenzyme A thioesterase PaaI-like protein
MKAGMGKVRCEGKLVHRGRTLARAEARIVDAEGRLLAYGHSTCMILKLDGAERRA